MRKDLLKVGAGMVAGRLLSLMLVLMYSSFLSLTEFGLLSALIAMSTVFSTLVMVIPQNFIINHAAVLYSKNKYRELGGLAFISAATPFSVLVLFFLPILLYSTKVSESEIPAGFIFLSTLSVAALLVLVPQLRSMYGVGMAQAIEQIARPIFAILIFIVLLMFGVEYSGYWSHILSFIGASVVGSVFLCKFFLRNVSEWSGVESNLKKNAAKLIPIAIPVYLLAVSRIGIGEAGTLGAFYWVDSAAAGVYRFYAQLTLVVSFPLFVINYYYAPKIAVFADAGDYTSIRKVMKLSTFYGGGIALAAFLFIIAIVNLSHFKVYYSDFYDRNMLLGMMGFAVWLTVLSGPAGLVLIALRKSLQAALVVLVSGAINIALMWKFSLMGYGVNGVGAAYAMAMLTLTCAQGVLARRHLSSLDKCRRAI